VSARIKQRLDQKIAEVERRLTKLRALREAFDDEELASEVKDLFAGENGAGHPAAPQRREGRNIVTLREYFQNRENAWATIAEIVTDTGMSKHSLRQVLYRSHVTTFDRQKPKGSRRESRFRLKPEKEKDA